MFFPGAKQEPKVKLENTQVGFMLLTVFTIMILIGNILNGRLKMVD